MATSSGSGSGCPICDKVSNWFGGGAGTLAGQTPLTAFLWVGFLLITLIVWGFIIKEIQGLI